MTQPPLWLARQPAAGRRSSCISRTVPTSALRAQLAKERRHAQQMSELHLATIEALALAIDAKDQTAHNHIGRVQIYATALARALGMSDEDVQAVKTAALLHDIGKLAVPEHILAKPGPLTPEEFQKVRVHPQVGADIIAGIPFPYPVAPLILSHHERWDGRGYPVRPAGRGDPARRADSLPRRLLRFADVESAVPQADERRGGGRACFSRKAGKALDPTAVDAFLRILPEIATGGREVRPCAPRA